MNTEAGLKPIARIDRTICRSGIGLLVLIALCAHGTRAAAQSTDSTADKENRSDSSSYRGGSIRIGAFAITDISSRIYYGPRDLPIALPLDIQEDLGFKDSRPTSAGFLRDSVMRRCALSCKRGNGRPSSFSFITTSNSSAT